MKKYLSIAFLIGFIPMTFGTDIVTSVPEAGASVMFLVLGLIGLGLIAKKSKK